MAGPILPAERWVLPKGGSRMVVEGTRQSLGVLMDIKDIVLCDRVYPSVPKGEGDIIFWCGVTRM